MTIRGRTSGATVRPVKQVYRVVLTGWREGMQKIPVTKTIQRLAGYRLGEAKACTDAVLDGHWVTIRCFSSAEAQELALALVPLGVEVDVRHG